MVYGLNKKGRPILDLNLFVKLFIFALTSFLNGRNDVNHNGNC